MQVIVLRKENSPLNASEENSHANRSKENSHTNTSNYTILGKFTFKYT